MALAIFGGIISFLKEWKRKSHKDYDENSNVLAFAILSLVVVGALMTLKLANDAVNEKAISDSIAKDF